MKNKILIIISFTLLACGSKTPTASVNLPVAEMGAAEKILKSVSPGYKESFTQGSVVKIGFKTGPKVDSVQIFVDGVRQSSQEFIPQRVGKVNFRVVAFKNGEDQSMNGQFTVLAKNAPAIHKVKIVRKYPHDPNAYTQGLLFHKGRLYESTGERGRSSVREVELATGKILRKKDLEKKYFGEGLALLNEKLYQLTWEEGVVFVYDINTFEKVGEFPISGEGWGITTDGTYLYVSDGTNKITKYDADKFKKISFIEVADNKQLLTELNELEWIDGRIWANVYTLNLIAVIDPQSGAVEKYVDCSELVSKIGNYNKADVLNGIAYDKATGRIWLTGKDWDTLFEISL